MLFALSTYATSVKPGMFIQCSTIPTLLTFYCDTAIQSISETDVKSELAKNLKNIAAAHFIITLAITGIVGLQITHYVLNKRADNAERAEAAAAAAAKKSK
jgi:hypothetical protein